MLIGRNRNRFFKHLEDYSTNFPLEISEEVIDQQANQFTDLIVGSTTSFFGPIGPITLLSPSTTLNLACTSLMIRKYQRNSKNSTQKKLEKMSLTCDSNMKSKKRQTVLELNQTSSSEIFFNITHIKQAIKNSKTQLQALIV